MKQPDNSAATYLVGGGIASLAAAVFLIRDVVSAELPFELQTQH